MVELECDNCHKKYITMKSSHKSNHHFCSRACQMDFRYKSENLTTSFCIYCGKEFQKTHAKHVYCSLDCCYQYKYKEKDKDKFDYTCDNCGKSFKSFYKKKGTHIFCSHECSTVFRSKNSYKTVSCLVCGKEFEIQKSDNRKTCSVECRNLNQSISTLGKNSPTYNHNIPDGERIARCKKCGKEFPIKLRNREKPKFCSRKCALSEIAASLTKPHRLTCDMLQSLDIEFDIEFKIRSFLIDTYISDKIMIEVMGTFWHCDCRNYQCPINEKQIKNVERDKRKQETVCQDFGCRILYLWEEDIIKQPELCKEIIKEYVQNNGILNNYHSMNYHIENNNLILNDSLFIPFFEQ